MYGVRKHHLPSWVVKSLLTVVVARRVVLAVSPSPDTYVRLDPLAFVWARLLALWVVLVCRPVLWWALLQSMHSTAGWDDYVWVVHPSHPLVLLLRRPSAVLPLLNVAPYVVAEV